MSKHFSKTNVVEVTVHFKILYWYTL